MSGEGNRESVDFSLNLSQSEISVANLLTPGEEDEKSIADAVTALETAEFQNSVTPVEGQVSTKTVGEPQKQVSPKKVEPQKQVSPKTDPKTAKAGFHTTVKSPKSNSSVTSPINKNKQVTSPVTTRSKSQISSTANKSTQQVSTPAVGKPKDQVSTTKTVETVKPSGSEPKKQVSPEEKKEGLPTKETLPNGEVKVQDSNSESEKQVSSKSQDLENFQPFEMAPIQQIQLNTFTPNNVTLWLKMVKCRLNALGIKDEELFKYIRMDMPMEIADRIPELLEPSEANDNFQYFSEKLKAVYGKTREQDIRELLNKLNLTDEGPIRLMDKMIEKAGNDLSDMVIADLFRSKMPKEVARLLNVLAIKTDDLRKLAESAEQLYQFERDHTSPQVCGVAAGNSKASDTSTKSYQKQIDDLKSELGHLKKVVDGLLDKKNSSNNNNNNSGNRRSRSRSPKRQEKRSQSKNKIDYNLPENKGKCSYHVKFGDKAYHCVRPCIESHKELAPKPDKSSSDKSQGNSKASQ